jgi:hypothetical protein
MLCELRGRGQQTVVPPSFHPSGEPQEWERGGLESPPDRRWPVAALITYAGRVAAAALLGRHWPDGNRHQAALALAGGLLRAGWSQEPVATFVRAVAAAAADEEIDDRVRAVRDTAAALAGGKSDVTGWPRLQELLGEVGASVVPAIVDWLGLGLAATPEPWPARPRPFVDEALPLFPTHLLPEWMAAMVEGAAEETQTPPDVAGMIALASLALGAQRQVRARVRSGLGRNRSPSGPYARRRPARENLRSMPV